MLHDPNLRAPLAVALGAILGALGRYYLTIGCVQWFGTSVFGTLTVNLVGAWVMGCLVTLITERLLSLPSDVMLLLATGCLGSFTTFSTYILDTVNLAREYTVWLGIVYWLGSAIGGVITLLLGVMTARLLP